MIDWVTVTIPACLPHPITGGCLIDHDENGEIRYTLHKRMVMTGSHAAKVNVRAVNTDEIEVSGNIVKFMQGHNIYGPDQLRPLLVDFLNLVLPKIYQGFMPQLLMDAAWLSRVDVTSGFVLDRAGDVVQTLEAIEQTARIAYKGRGVLEGSTLVFGRANKGERAKDWQIVMYSKGHEVAKRPLPDCMMEDHEVMDYVNRLLRCEVRLRGAELKRLGFARVSDWREDTAMALWREKMDRLELSEVRQVETAELECITPRLRNAYAAWKHGEDLRKGMSKSAFYALRRRMKEELNIDIALRVPRSNVIPIVRVVELRPAHRPPWADRVDRLLAA